MSKTFFLTCNICNTVIPKENVGIRYALHEDEIVAICFCHNTWFKVRYKCSDIKNPGDTAESHPLVMGSDLEYDFNYYMKCSVDRTVYKLTTIPKGVVLKEFLVSSYSHRIALEPKSVYAMQGEHDLGTDIVDSAYNEEVLVMGNTQDVD